MRPYKSREDYFSLELPEPQTSFTIRTDIFQTKTIDILFCLISGDIQHSTLRKVSYLFKKKNETAEQIKTSLYTDVVFFFFSFFSRTSASENERGAREGKIKNFLLPHP